MARDEEDDEGDRGSRRLLPLMLDLHSRLVVIFGGGGVGERRARRFLPYAPVKVVSREFTAGLMGMGSELELVRCDLWAGFADHLDGAFIVIPATSDSDLNRAIEQEATARKILVNRVEGAGDVVVPSIIRKEPITIAISTEIPALSKHLRLHLERELCGNYQEMARLLSQIRTELKGQIPGQKDRARIIWEILDDEEIWRLLEVSYEKAYMRARSHACQDERDSLDAGDPSQGLDQ